MDKNTNFSVKIFDIAVTSKYGRSHWKWYEQVKLSELYRHTKFDIYQIYVTWINANVNVFNKPTHDRRKAF